MRLHFVIAGASATRPRKLPQRGSGIGRQLQRLYGTAFFDKKDLDAHLEQIEEAKRRDHRVWGKKHGLFFINPEVGQRLCLWLPKGERSLCEIESMAISARCQSHKRSRSC